ncbi:Kunitz/Bovine pancreatic trypsin inhibitor domain protein [Cooperia oncophora]
MLGVGDATLPRFYYDPLEDSCLPFNYTGIGGNENNFATKAQCQINCPGYRGYCPHGKPHVVGGVMTKCGIDTFCPLNHVCHVSKRDSISICCPDPGLCVQLAC